MVGYPVHLIHFVELAVFWLPRLLGPVALLLLWTHLSYYLPLPAFYQNVQFQERLEIGDCVSGRYRAANCTLVPCTRLVNNAFPTIQRDMMGDLFNIWQNP